VVGVPIRVPSNPTKQFQNRRTKTVENSGSELHVAGTVRGLKSASATMLPLPSRGVLARKPSAPASIRPGDRLFSPGEDGPHFTMREEYSGPLLPLIWRSMPDLGPLFR
jgi:hypothetical protein